ncbi:MAG: heme lyase CcmF/NrfE family subunit [Endozoicomonadaceae bacterium]|nr:heme lyase CcmF/NrfE family subunit [Endozoicomonadaceae bacterium]
MIPELGHLCLILALCFSALLLVIPPLGLTLKRQAWYQFAYPLTWGLFLLILTAFLLLTFSFITNDFSVAYVAAHSNTQLPIWYQVSAVWSAHEGSILMWILIQAGWMLAVLLNASSIPEHMLIRVLSILGFIIFGFLLFTLATSNPFLRYLPYPPQNGDDLIPLLQDFALIIHPPILYIGYVGFSVPFAFVTALLIAPEKLSNWSRWVRPWTLIAWAFLTLGIALGSWWAYYELGWGGWWFWDPVENASFMPWLLGVALLHALAIAEKRELFAQWTLFLGISTFALCLLGTFLVRSGLLSSVHTFANDSERGTYLLCFLSLVIGLAFLLYAYRATRLSIPKPFDWLSTEMMLLINNLLLGTACFIVLLGTLFPLIMSSLDWGDFSVGPPYFNTLFTPLTILTLWVLGTGLSMRWQKTALPALLSQWKSMIPIATLLAAIACILFLDHLTPTLFLALTGCSWVVAATIQDITYRFKKADKKGLYRIRLNYWGMHCAHLGLVMAICGAALTTALNQENEVKVLPGMITTLGDYQFRFDGVSRVKGPNYQSHQAKVTIFKNKHQVATLYPEKRQYLTQTDITTEIAIDPGFFRDLYIALGEPLEDHNWTIRFQVKPFIRWIWLGAILMALGALLCVWGRKRHPKIMQTKILSPQI